MAMPIVGGPFLQVSTTLPWHIDAVGGRPPHLQVQLLGLAAARLLTIEGAPAKDVRARMTGTCGRSCQAVGSFFTPDRRAKTCPCYKCNPAACRAGNKAVPEAGRGGGTCSPASENIR